MLTQKQKLKSHKKTHYATTRKLQSGGYILQTENDFFDWLNKDENIEKLLKSTLRLMQHKKETAKKLLKNEKNQLAEFYASNVLITAKGIEETKPLESLARGKGGGAAISQLIEQIGSTIRADKAKYLANTIETILSTISSIETLEAIYDKRRDEICSTIFIHKDTPEKYKEALHQKRKTILKGVNTFLEEFTGESNRRHRLFILNYAIDFAENWTSFQDNYRLNIILTGGAGLGKTTFAKAIGPLFYEFGLLAKPDVKVREKRDFIAEYLGQTQTRTYSTLYSGIESVIFIDEAYSVSGCGKLHGYDYGQEFIDALVDVTQKSRGLFSIIAAGYKSEMHHCFLDKNPGMRRRFPNELELKPYTVLDLDNILIGGILKKFFPVEIKGAYEIDLLKERGVYFANSPKFRQHYDELQKRTMLSMPPDKQLKNATDDSQRETQLVALKSELGRIQTIERYRTKILGLFRFFLMLTSFDTHFSSFQELFAVHSALWKTITGDTAKQFKFNMYRLLAILYMSQHQQKREILKSFILRSMFSEKEGSLFPNQAGDMGTLATFILAEPSVNENKTTQLQTAVNIFNNYFVTRGGSKLMLDVDTTGGKSELYIYYVGGGFVSHRDFETTVIDRLFKGLTDGGDASELWTLGSLPAEKRAKIVFNINALYTQAVLALSRDSEQSLKETDATAQAEKRLPSGIDARFLDAEVRTYKSMLESSPEKFGKEEMRKALSFVNTDDYEEDDTERKAALETFIEEGEGSGEKVKEELDIQLLCPNLPKPLPQGRAAATDNRTFYPEMNEEQYLAPVTPPLPTLLTRAPAGLTPNELPPTRTLTRGIGWGDAPIGLTRSSAVSEHFDPGPPVRRTDTLVGLRPSASRSITSYGYYPPAKQPPNYLYFKKGKHTLLDDWFDMVEKGMYITPLEKKPSFEIAFYILRDKFRAGSPIVEALDAIVPGEPGYHLFGIRRKQSGTGALRGLLAPTFLYRLIGSKKTDTPESFLQVGGPPESTPWKFVYVGEKDTYLNSGADYYDYGIHIVNKYPDYLYYLEKTAPTDLVNFKSLEKKLVRDRPILGRKARYVISSLVERPTNLTYPANFPPNTVFFQISYILNLRSNAIYGLILPASASKISNVSPPVEGTPFKFMQAELMAGPGAPGLRPSPAGNGGPVSPVPPPPVPNNGTRRNKRKNTGTLNANSPQVKLVLPLPPSSPRDIPDTLYYMGSKKQAAGFSQEPLTLQGEFLEVAPQVRDKRYKIKVGLRQGIDGWFVMVEDTQIPFTTEEGLVQYTLKIGKDFTPSTVPPASGSKPWVFSNPVY